MKGLAWKIPVFAVLGTALAGYAIAAFSKPDVSVREYTTNDGRVVSVESLLPSTGARRYLPGLPYRDGRTVITVTNEGRLERVIIDNNNNLRLDGRDSVEEIIADGTVLRADANGFVTRDGKFYKSDQPKAPGILTEGNHVLQAYGSAAAKAK